MSRTIIAEAFEQQWSALERAIAACRVKPTRSAAHDLRRETRVLGATLQKLRDDHPSSAVLRRQTDAVLKQLKGIRHGAGAVRDLDVHRKLLKPFEKDQHVGDEASRVRSRLKLQRAEAAAELQKLLKRHEVKLERKLEELRPVISRLAASDPAPLTTARRWVRASTAQHQPVTTANLHDLRKETKGARYLAGLQPRSAEAVAFARGLGRLHSLIGDWHDWDLLAEEVKSARGKKSMALQDRLIAERDRALHLAMRNLHRTLKAS